MFATPFSAPLHETLASHVFGRFMPQRAPVAATLVTPALVVDATAEEEEPFDLAQRVREVGEW
ncbi:MAG: hypothetical protein KKG67_11110 [Gammaproteobacteria bacterium]|nr:hypothetical protein [Gammaproteobacteria bacterium]